MRRNGGGQSAGGAQAGSVTTPILRGAPPPAGIHGVCTRPDAPAQSRHRLGSARQGCRATLEGDPDQAFASAAVRMPCKVPVGVIASGSIRQCSTLGRPLARARARAGAKSSVRSTRSPWPPKAWA